MFFLYPGIYAGYITELLDEINRWCEEKRQSVEIVVNDWGMASLVKKSRRNLIPSLGILLNKRRKRPSDSVQKRRTEMV